MKKLINLFVLIIPLFTYGQSDLINAGPMPGYSEMKEVPIWIQTTKEAEVFARYWVINKSDSIFHTNTVTTNKDKAFTAILIADTLEPGFEYEYAVFVNGKKIIFPYSTTFTTQKLWKWRTDPPEFSFLMGSGAYINEQRYDRPGRPYGDKYEIYSFMADKKANFMIWLGDNVYLREPNWNSQTGIFG